MSEQEIYIEAINRRDPAERRRFLDEVCAGNEVLRERIETLIRQSDQLGSFLENSPQPLGATADISVAVEKPGTQIGPYKLLQQIGEGGMGTVFMAEQSHPVQRKVALKVIKAGMDSGQVIARFEAERQALALMDHPNIAKVLDAGTTAAGRPYFVMELVKGVPITTYCDENHLPPQARLELFTQVCQAVQHAHHKGVIHRDLKPTNVLVTLYDDKPVPKVIDFGVAKATGGKLTERTMFTGYGQIVGTLEYMSPEQARLNALDIDTRGDIYSLGVLLYELLTGTTPFDKKRLREAAFDEMLRIVREEEPPKPSTRLSTAEGRASIAANRSMEPNKLSGLVRGELDWIVMKALEKDRNRRYETANGFAMDVQRYLADEPVTACPPSMEYRLRKFVRRNKGPVLAGTLVLLTLVGGIIGTTFGLIEARRERDAAQQARNQAVQAQRNEAERAAGEHRAKQAALAAAEAEKQAREGEAAQRQVAEANEKTASEREAETRAVLDFVQHKVIAAARPEGQEGGLGYNVTLRRALEAALPFVEESFSEQPLIEAKLRMTLGESFEYLGETAIANEQYQAARAIYVKELGAGHRDTIAATYKLASNCDELGRKDEALKLSKEVLEARQATLGPDQPETLAALSTAAGRSPPADALPLYQELLSRQTARFGADHAATLDSRSGLARCHAAQLQHDQAVTIYESLVRLQKIRLGSDHSSTLTTMTALADCYAVLDRRTDAVKLYKEVIATFKARTEPDDFLESETIPKERFAELHVTEQRLAQQQTQFGVDHPESLRIMKELVSGYLITFENDKGIKAERERLEALTDQLGANHPRTLDAMRDLARKYQRQGLRRDAITLLEDVRVRQQAQLGPGHPAVRATTIALAFAYSDAGRHRDALPLHEQLLPLLQAKLGHNHRDTLLVRLTLAWDLTQLNRHTDAVKIREELIPLLKTTFGIGSPATLACMRELGRNYLAFKRTADAVQLLEETLSLAKVHLGADDRETRMTIWWLARGYAALNRYEEAIRLSEDIVELSAARFGADHLNTLWYMNCLALNNADSKRYAEAVKIAEKLLELGKSSLSPNSNIRISTMGCLQRSYVALGRHEDAIQLLKKTLQGKRDEYGANSTQALAAISSLSQFDIAMERHSDAAQLYEEQFRLLKDQAGLKSEEWVNQQLAKDYVALGMAHHADQKLDEAIAAYKRAIELNPLDATAYCKLGDTFRALKRFDEAIAALRKAVELNPKYAHAHYILGRTFRDQELLNAAIVAYRNSIECDPNDAWAYYHVGRCLQIQRKLDEAIVALRKAIEINPKHAWAHGRLAIALRDQKKFDEAIKMHTEAVAINNAQYGPNHIETLQYMSTLAVTYFAAGRRADAVRLREELLPLQKANLGPQHADTLKTMSDLAANYDVLRRFAEAIKVREELLPLRKAKLGPDHGDTLRTMSGLAANYVSAERHDDALKTYEELIPRQKAKLGVDHTDTLYSMSQLASVDAHLGRILDALKLNEETLALRTAKLGPQHRDTLVSMNNLAWLLATCSDPMLRDPQRAVDLAAKAAALEPQDAYHSNTLGVALYRTGHWKPAIAALEKSMSLRKGGDSLDWFFLAMAHWQLDEKDEARKRYAKAVEWMEKNKPENEELRRFQAEATELLKIENKPAKPESK